MQQVPRKQSFTLIELLFALGIIALLVMIGMPVIGTMMQGNDSNTASNVVRNAVMSARNRAVAEQEQGIVWLAEGSIVESGTFRKSTVPINFNLSSPTNPTDYLDNADASTVLMSPTAASTSPGNSTDWGISTTGSPKGANAYYCSRTNAQAAWATQEIPAGYSGTLTLKVWIRVNATNRSTNVSYSMVGSKGDASITPAYKSISHMDGSASELDKWVQVGLTNEFVVSELPQNERLKIQMINPNGDNTNGPTGALAWFDAAALVGTLSPAQTADVNWFKIMGKAWTPNMWQGAQVIFANLDDSTTTSVDESGPVVAPITSNTSDTCYCGITQWQNVTSGGILQNVSLTDGSKFIIQFGDPLSPQGQQQLGSGTTTIKWNGVPETVLVSPFDAVYATRRVFPIQFDTYGRATFSNADGYITIKIYSRESPNDQSMWRFIRVYGNTGRTVVGRTLAELAL